MFGAEKTGRWALIKLDKSGGSKRAEIKQIYYHSSCGLHSQFGVRGLSMQDVDLLINGRWVIPVEPSETVLEDHTVVVRAGRIVDVLPQSEAVETFTAPQSVDRPHHAIIPGLVNAHTHAGMTLFRGLADDMPLAEWLHEHIWPAEVRWAGPDFVRDGTALAIAEMLRSGTTCFNDMYYFPDVVAQSAIDLGIRAVVGMIVIEQPTVWAQNAEEYLSKGLAVHDQFRGHALISTAFAPHAPYSVHTETLQNVRVLADQLETPVHIHLHETAGEILSSQDQHGCRPLQQLEEVGLVSPLLTAVHMTQLEDSEIELLAERGASVVHCPESNLKLASGFCPVARLLEAGVNVALGTDSAASNNDLDMFGEMRTAALLGKAVADDAAAVSAADVLTLATLNGARALGLADEIGSLVAGKWADVACVDLGPLECQPVHHPLSQLVYSVGRDQVTDVWVAGQPTLTERRLNGVDVDELLLRVEGWRRRLGNSDD